MEKFSKLKQCLHSVIKKTYLSRLLSRLVEWHSIEETISKVKVGIISTNYDKFRIFFEKNIINQQVEKQSIN